MTFVKSDDPEAVRLTPIGYRCQVLQLFSYDHWLLLARGGTA
jgi:hypothetical protein